ncbi:hypothetical protein I8746_10570 [Pseudomonas sp. USTB-Z]|uniref:hypothetical protein n=1 Tax=Pseudomonas sp. USTB-Z TaxID=2794351 RepID=UPI001C83602A|nr:hypothetical protein [Pseudomonas sp. USTB-Z]MBX6690046.1 hypothetical protein [Pseudomonas sp. USTB-Z]
MVNKRTATEQSRALFAALIAHTKDSLEESVDYTASWLIEGEIGSPSWVVRGKNDTIETINFSQPLGNLTNLADAENKVILEAIQKQAFLLRTGYLQKNIGFDVWLKHIRGYINIASWASLHEERYQPKIYGLRLINENACKLLSAGYSQGGWAGVLEFKDRISDLLCQATGELYNGLGLTPDQILKICEHLKTEKLYSSADKDQSDSGLVSRIYLAELLGTNPSAFQHDSMRAFLRQFEVSLQGPILVEGTTRRAKHQSQRASLSQSPSTSVTKKSLKQFLIILKSLAAGNQMLPDVMPNFKLDIKTFLNNTEHRLDGHTKKIPHSIGMLALDKAIEWIIVYGKPIVDATIELVKNFNSQEFIDNTPPRYLTSERQKLFEKIITHHETSSFDNLPAQQLSTALGITKLTSLSPKSNSAESMTFAIALECFVAACAIVIGLTKPIRASELANIKRNSLFLQTNGEGAFLKHPSLKKGLENPPIISRPIPYISAVAVELLSVLGNNLKTIYKDTSAHSADLFYFPSSKGFNCPGGQQVDVRIDTAIRSFCDIIEIPIDTHGRRWYIKVHEMRKFFILSMYRHERFFTEDALRHQAGHADRKHLDDYLSGDIPDEEFIQYTIECIEDKLIELELGQIDEKDHQGLSAVYKHALETLECKSIKSTNQYKFDQFVRALLNHDGFLISTYTIRLTTYESTVIDTDIAIKFGDLQDESFDNR